MTSTYDSTKSINSAWGLDDEPQSTSRNQIPAFFNIEDLDDEDELKKWFETAIPIFQDQQVDFTRKAIENMMFFKGVHMDPNRDYYTFDDVNRYYRQSDVSFNIIYEFVELWVNRMGSFKPEIGCVPATNDSDARDHAEAKELALKDFFHKNKIDQLFNRFDRHNFSLGEAYIHCFWDQDRGPLHPAFSEIESKYKASQRLKTESGEEVNVNRLPRIGDVATEIVPAIYVYMEDRPWEELDYLILDRPINVDKLRSDYPDVDISGEGDISCFWMYHLPTKYLPNGRFVKYANGEVLENTDYKYPRFPIVRMTNIDTVGSHRGSSFIERIKSHQVLINQTISEVWNNLRRTNKGKWVVPAKTCNPRHLHPQSPSIEYYGAVPPKFVSYDSIKPEAIQFIELMRDYAEKQARIQGIVQGTPPPNVRSARQFAQLEEMEKRSVEITVAKKYAAIEDLGEIVAMIMADKYKESDGRTITVYGRDKEYLNTALNIDAVREAHTVRVQTDELPMGKVSQLNFFSELRQETGPSVVPDEMFIDMLDSGRFNQYTEFGGATVETTMAQMSQMIKGETPEAPGAHEDLILKWKLVVGTMRKRAYLAYSNEVKALFEDFLYAIENLIVNKPNKSMMMQEKLQTLESFPVLYKDPSTQFMDAMPPAPPVPPEAGMAEQAEALAATDGMEEIPPELLGGNVPV